MGLFLQEKAVIMDTVHRIFFSPEQMKSKQSTKFSATSIKKENVVSAVTSALIPLCINFHLYFERF